MLIFFVACAAPKESRKEDASDPSRVVFEGQKHFRKGESIEIMADNPTGDTLYLYKPKNLVIQKQEPDGWQKIRTLYCPCGASCPAPPDVIPLPPGNQYTYIWDQMEAWCGDMTREGIRKMHRSFPGYGKYRIGIRLLNQDTQQVKVLYRSFTIRGESQ